jgi:N-acetyl-anhydromuramyl-L-alanine amidase AmpD
VIDREGGIWRVVPDDRVAWHAGVSELAGAPNVNHFSLGIELVGRETQADFPALQVESAAEWCAAKCRQYGIPVSRIVTHAAVALPLGRKVDPGPGLRMDAFRAAVTDLLHGPV